ncbi:MAG TPA: flavodoxin family protein [Firmicutes bacterium]|nr:flavodoxin family protein [Bacillota bacterium]
MKIVYISGSPRENSNTDYLLNLLNSQITGEFIKLSEYQIESCRACMDCRGKGKCVIVDEMSKLIIPKLLVNNVIVLGSPVYFNNVSSQMKVFMDRTHCLIGLLKNKIGGCVVVGRRYGAESAITAINGYFTKHSMIPANRGVLGYAFNTGEMKKDVLAVEDINKLAERIIELERIIKSKSD